MGRVQCQPVGYDKLHPSNLQILASQTAVLLASVLYKSTDFGRPAAGRIAMVLFGGWNGIQTNPIVHISLTLNFEEIVSCRRKKGFKYNLNYL